MEKLDIKHLRVLYFQYKDTAIFSFGVSALILLVNLIIFSAVVRPQFAVWQENNRQLEEVKKKIEVLEQNNRTLQGIDPAELSNDLKLALAGLPKEQDFLGIMNAIASATATSGVILDDYTFTLGKIVPANADVLPVSVTMNVRGDADTLHSFMTEIHQKVPTANLVSIDGTASDASVTVSFYSKLLSPITLTEDKVTTPLPATTSSERELLQKLASWQATLLPTDDFSLVGSSSADISPF